MLLDQESTLKLLKKYNLPTGKSKLCKSFSECEKFAKTLGFPLALKIDSPNVIHKSDIGAVKIDIDSFASLKKNYEEILFNVKKFKKDARINGVLVQKQYLGHSILVGMKRDLTFGPVIVFGIGGVTVELIKDVSRRIAPITKSDAKEMIKEIQMFEILKGYRGKKGANIDSLVDILVKLSNLSINEENILELDFNPVISDDKKSFIVDARVMLN